MIEETLIISDTNIFLDLITINILDALFQFPCNICTTDFVVNEIEWPEQRAHIKIADLQDISFSFEELREINELYNNSSTSITDCSVWYLAKKQVVDS